jgi:ankyrin repeat protein
MTALMRAAAGVQPEVVKLYLAKKPNVNARDVAGRSVLFFAVNFGGQVETVRLLLASGADPNAAAWRSNGETPLMLAASQGKTAIVQALLKAGADPNALDLSGNTALSKTESPAIANLLRRAGAKP